MSQDINAMMTGFADSLNKYMGLSVANGLERQKEVRKNALELEKGKELKIFEGQVDLAKTTATKLYEQTIAGKVDPETAASISPDGAKWVEGFHKANSRFPTVDEFDKGFGHSVKSDENKLRRQDQNDARMNRFVMSHTDKLAAAKIPELLTTYNELASVMKTKKDVAGIGMADGLVPNFLLSDEGKANRTNLQQIANTILQQRSGAAVSDQEYKRFLTEMRGGKMPDEGTLRKHIGKMGKDIHNFISLREAGIPKEALELYKSHPGAITSDQVDMFDGNTKGVAANKKGSGKPTQDDPLGLGI